MASTREPVVEQQYVLRALDFKISASRSLVSMFQSRRNVIATVSEGRSSDGCDIPLTALSDVDVHTLIADKSNTTSQVREVLHGYILTHGVP
jgi:hypothetical protein